MKFLNVTRNSATTVVAAFLFIATSLTVFLHGQTKRPGMMIVKESELPLDDATNELARVRIITSGKIVRVSELLQKARESLKAQTELRPEMQSNFLVTVYADPDRTNLCWIGFSGGFGQKRFHVEFDKSGNIVSKKVLVPSAE